MSEKTQECSADQVSRAEITSQDLLRELMKAELRHLRIRNLQEEEKLFADARANEAIEKKAAAANAPVAYFAGSQGNLNQGQVFSRDAGETTVASMLQQASMLTLNQLSARLDQVERAIDHRARLRILERRWPGGHRYRRLPAQR
jgi:hypothetical protein